MPRPSAKLLGVRLFLGGALLASIAILGASCAEALGVADYTDTFAEACDVAARCYGPAYKDCAKRIAKIDAEGTAEDWLTRVTTTACLDKCSELQTCLDIRPLCYPLYGDDRSEAAVGCNIAQDCCGVQDGTIVCESGLCCRAIGATCKDDFDCCPSAGRCEEGTCGNTTCAAANAPCLNSFQCCSGRCNDAKFCEEIPCPPEGFACESAADCCDLECKVDAGGQKRCTHPSCAQVGEPCTSAADCCDTGGKCYKGSDPSAPSGVCSPQECTPNNSDCSSDETGAGSDCCSGYCHPAYHLCGSCVGAGEACSDAIPCCADSKCDGSGTCVANAMP